MNKIVHVLPFDRARGAQRYARALVDRLRESHSACHLIVTLFEGEGSDLSADSELLMPRGRLRDLGFDPRVAVRLRSELVRQRPDLVVAHGGESAKYSAIAVARHLPLIYLSIGTADNRLSRPFSRAMYRLYTRRASLVAAVSQAVADEVHHQGVPVEKIMVIPNGRDANQYQVSRSSEERSPRLIWIGELDLTKRPETFVELVASLRRSRLELEAWMVGDGPRAAEVAALAALADVEMLGRRDDVPALLAESDLLVFTGVPPEGMPGVLIEAGMAGLPVVTTRVPGASEVVEDRRTGVLVDIDDIERLTWEVGQLLDNEDLRRSMGRRARQHCVERFSLAGSVALWEQAFDRVLEQNGGER